MPGPPLDDLRKRIRRAEEEGGAERREWQHREGQAVEASALLAVVG